MPLHRYHNAQMIPITMGSFKHVRGQQERFSRTTRTTRKATVFRSDICSLIREPVMTRTLWCSATILQKAAVTHMISWLTLIILCRILCSITVEICLILRISRHARTLTQPRSMSASLPIFLTRFPRGSIRRHEISCWAVIPVRAAQRSHRFFIAMMRIREILQETVFKTAETAMLR